MERQPLYVNPITLDLAWRDPTANLERIESVIRLRLKKNPGIPPEAQLFLFPELSLTGFVTENPPAYRIDPPHENAAALSRIARDNKVGIAAGFPEENPKDAGRPFNTMALIDPVGRFVARYRKTHLFTWGENSESKTYSPGDRGVLVEYRGWKIAFATCFDIRFPAFFHAYAKEGVDLVLTAACWIGGPHKSYQFKTINSAHAVLSQAFIAAVNRCGRDPFYHYDGAEYVFSPFGEEAYAQEPFLLDSELLASARALSVRPSDKSAYPVDIL